MERKILMKKDSIEKRIPENLVSEYMQLGWEKVRDRKNEDFSEKPNSFRLK